MDRFTQMEVFRAVVEHRSFTAAADHLATAKSTISRHVSALEERLGVRLLNRTTRSVHPTEMGLAYYERCLQVLADAEEADRAVTALSNDPVGRLRVASAPAFAAAFLVEPIASFLEQYPQVEVDLVLEDRFVDLVEEGLDVAIRISDPNTPDLIARRLGESHSFLCASPAYLAAHGVPEHPEDLVRHQCVSRSVPGGTVWDFEGPDGPFRVEVGGRFHCNHGDALMQAVLDGVGIGYVPDFMLRPHLDAGALQTVLQPWTRPPRQVNALFPHRRLLSTKVRLFIDFLVDRFTPRAPWACPTR